MTTTRLQVRASTYRGEAGFLICGTNAHGARVSIFVTTREEAEAVRANLRAGRWAFESAE